MNATPQCYDYEVGSPGWSFFYSNEALPDNRLGIAQLSNRLLIPPDALPFQGNPNGEFLGYIWMALPFTDPTTGDPPTGDQSWTCFLSAANFKGPIAYYIPETWSKIGKLFNYPFIYGRGLDARPGIMGGGAMEINTVPRFDAKDAQGTTYSKLPKLQWPVDAEGRAFLVQDVTYYSKAALYDAFKAWRDGGPPAPGDSTRKARSSPSSTRARRATIRPARRSSAWSAPSTPASSRATCGACSGSPTTSPRKACSRNTTSMSAKNASPCPRRKCPRKPNCSRRNSSSPSRECPTPRPPSAPGPSPARNLALSRPGSWMVRW